MKKALIPILAVIAAIAIILCFVLPGNATKPLNDKIGQLEETVKGMFSQEQVDKAVADAKEGLLDADAVQAKVDEAAAAAKEGLLDADAVQAKVDEAAAAAKEGMFDADTVESKITEAIAAAKEGLLDADAVQAKIDEAVADAKEGLLDADAVQAKVDEAAAAAKEGLLDADAVQAKVDEATAAAKEGLLDADAVKATVDAAVAEAVALKKNPRFDGKLVILHTNDIHGHAMADDTELGYARIATLKKNLEAMGAEVLLVDAGDAAQGAPIVNVSQGHSAVEFMNAAGYDLAIPGNHEFDWGFDNLMQNAADAKFTYLCANLLRTSGNDLVFDANKIIETKNGLKIGVFGLDTPETMTKTNPEKVKGIRFLQQDELYACAQAQADELKAAGCDLIVCIGHLGQDNESYPNRSIDVLAKVTDVDLFIDAHSHTTIDGGIYDPDSKALRVSTGSYSNAIGYVIVDINKEGETPEKNLTAGLYYLGDQEKALMASGTELTPDPEVNEIVTAVNDEVEAQLGATFASTTVLLDGNKAPGVRTQETNLGDFVTDAILWAAKDYYGDQVAAAVTNGGGIRATIEAGDITMKTMKTVFPFGNEVAILTVKGSELLEALEAATFSTPEALGAFPQVAGIEFEINTAIPYEQGEQYPDSTYYAPAKPGSRVTIKTVGGEPFDAAKEYVIATNDFTAVGGDTYYAFKYPYTMSGSKSGLALEDALVNYTKTVLGGVVGEQYAAPQGRITIVEIAPVEEAPAEDIPAEEVPVEEAPAA